MVAKKALFCSTGDSLSCGHAEGIHISVMANLQPEQNTEKTRKYN
jgi:hypothetical protein